MTTTQKVNKTTSLISVESLAFMRPIDVMFRATDCKPRARMYALFDGIPVNNLITPTNGPDSGILGGRLFADQFGRITGKFSIPAMTFRTGKKEFRITENPNYMQPAINGSLYGYATAEFSSTGIKKVYQDTINIEITKTIERVHDPLAQSFFTYGIKGGMFVTKLDLFFYSKDDTLPVWVELREMVNGYPGPGLITPNARVTLNPSQVNLSRNGSVPTTFVFENPIYLEEDKDYCFVILSNCTSYFAYTCTMGERSFETGRIVFEQPLLGSLFKSQNNMTWTAEQYEDIKFTLYQAKFSTNVAGNVKLNTSAPATSIPVNQLSTTAGSNIIRATLTFDHNLEVGNKVGLEVDTKGTYNGLTASALRGAFNVSSVLDRRTVEFTISSNASVSGPIQHGGFVYKVFVTNTGAGYNQATPPSITFSAPPSGTPATGVAVIESGSIVGINITNAGSGYISPPTVTITSSVGVGATAEADLDIKANIYTNRAYSIVNPAIENLQLADTVLDCSYSYTRGNYEGGNVSSYTVGEPVPFNMSKRNWLPQNAWLCSPFNESTMMANRKSATLSMLMSTTNNNVSPAISLDGAHAMFSGNLINNQETESLLSDNPTAFIQSVNLIAGGAGYAAPPAIEFVNQYGCSGSGATATATVSGGFVTGISITNGGTGYTKPPFVVFTGASTVSAAASAILSDFNTELKPDNGQARSRYLTTTNTLATLAESARVFVEAYSNQNSSFEVYLRTSLQASGADHKEQNWTLMQCDIERNKSARDGEYLEYEFYLESIPVFDTYDIKIVFRSNNPIDVPWIRNYRAILTV
jgi:hypothetical protein